MIKKSIKQIAKLINAKDKANVLIKNINEAIKNTKKSSKNPVKLLTNPNIWLFYHISI
jgi:ABC-type hemin transport system substrate-binding protein